MYSSQVTTRIIRQHAAFLLLTWLRYVLAVTQGARSMGVRYRLVKGWPTYRIGSDGTIWSCKTPHGRGIWLIGKNWKKLKTHPTNRGYLGVSLFGNGKKTTKYIHKMVLEAFVGPCPKGMQCRHFPDPNKQNNHLENLRWGTPIENAIDREMHGQHPHGEESHVAKLTTSEVRKIKRWLLCGIGIRAIAEKLKSKVTPQNIRHIACGRTWRHV